MSSESWRDCWLPEEYEVIKELFTPEELEREERRIRAKMKRHEAMNKLGYGDVEVAKMNALGRMLGSGSRTTGKWDPKNGPLPWEDDE